MKTNRKAETHGQYQPGDLQGITASQICALCHGDFHFNCKIILLLNLLNSALTLSQYSSS